jgi:hypothetical protein
MKPRSTLLIPIVFLLLVVEVVTQTCPPCYQTRGHIVARNGYGVDGRPIVNIYIDWSTMPNFTDSGRAVVTTAVENGMAAWNDAMNPAVPADQWDHQIQYRFEPTFDPSKADFIVRKGSVVFGCIAIDTSVFPHVITFGENWLASSVEERAGRIKHELGHRLGLGHPGDYAGSNCFAGQTIMQGATNINCTGGSTEVTGYDVAQANRQFDSPETCPLDEPNPTAYGEEATPTPTPTPDPPPPPPPPGECNQFPSVCDPPDGWSWEWCCCVNEYLLNNGSWPCTDTPVIYDSNHDGLDLSDAEHGVAFDIDANGSLDIIAWPIDPDDRLLVYDRNGNGKVDDARELFGNKTPQPDSPSGWAQNGFLALAEFDKPKNGGNDDGLFSIADRGFSLLRLWSDKHRNGTSESDELETLPTDLVIELKYHRMNKYDRNGNRLRYRSGKWVWDVIFARAR